MIVNKDEKEQLKLLDANKLMAWLDAKWQSYRPRSGYDEFSQGAQTVLDYTEQAVEAGEFDALPDAKDEENARLRDRIEVAEVEWEAWRCDAHSRREENETLRKINTALRECLAAYADTENWRIVAPDFTAEWAVDSEPWIPARTLLAELDHTDTQTKGASSNG